MPVGRPFLRSLPDGKARPSPKFRTLDEAGPQCVSLDVAQHLQEMLLVLDGESLEAALPNMAAGHIIAMIPAAVRSAKPVHPVAEVAILKGPKQLVKVIGQQAPP